jgi:Spy/CpxP family protein refolding chaperone
MKGPNAYSRAALLLRWLTLSAVAGVLLGGIEAKAQASGGPPKAGHPGMAQATPQADLQRQLDSLRAQIAELRAALDRSAPPPMSEMGMRKRMEMGGATAPMTMDKGEMGMPPEGMRRSGGGMGGMEKKEMGRMMEMGEMGMKPGGMKPGAAADTGTTMGNTASPARPSTDAAGSLSSLPGVPGTSHLYHIGSTGFFLDQPGIQLTPDQQVALNRIKQRALLARSDAERRTEQAEEELWALTSAGQPAAGQVTAKVREIEKLRADARLSFVSAVGDATKVLTATQRSALLGTKPPSK